MPSPAAPRLLMLGARRAARAAARAAGYAVRAVPTPKDQGPDALLAAGRAAAAEFAPGFVVATTEAAARVVGPLREELGLPGPGAAVTARCTDKRVMKRAAAAAGVAVTPWEAVAPETDLGALGDRLGWPVVLKAPASSGSRGLRVARTPAELAALAAPGDLAETFVAGREVSLESFVSGGRARFHNATRYLEAGWANLVPGGLDAADYTALVDLAETLHRAFGITRGMTHLEAFLTPEGPRFSEIALRPPGGRLMELISTAYGFDAWRAFLSCETGGEPGVSAAPRAAAANRFLHPGPGTVTAVAGVEEARAMPGVEVRVRVAVGQALAARAGTGETAAEIRVEGPDEATCLARLEAATRAVRITAEPAASPGPRARPGDGRGTAG